MRISIFLFPAIFFLASCGVSNIKKESSKTEIQTIKEKGFYDQSSEKSPITLTLSGNSIANIGDEALKNKVETTKKIVASSSWDMTMAEAYESYSTFTFIFLGIGLLLIVGAIKWFSTTSAGKVTDALFSGGAKAISSITTSIEDRLTHLSPSSQEFQALSELADKVRRERERL